MSFSQVLYCDWQYVQAGYSCYQRPGFRQACVGQWSRKPFCVPASGISIRAGTQFLMRLVYALSKHVQQLTL